MTEVKNIVAQAQKFLEAGDYPKALDLYDLLLTTNPDDIQLRYCVASIYMELYRTGLALSMLKQVVKDAPEHAAAWNNLGICYKNAGLMDDARSAYEKALELNYDYLTLVNYSGLFINNGTPEAALKWAQKGLKLAPNTPQLKNHRALALLELGQWKEGFPAYDARFGLPGWSKRDFGVPMWKGERVKKLIIHGEQGLGDEILFMNAFDRVMRRVDSVVVECAERLVPVFEASFGVPCYPTEQALKDNVKDADAWIAMGSLFGIVGWDEHKTQYLKVTKPYPKSEKFRIGVSFRGGTKMTHEHLRNFAIESWKPLLDYDAEFISLQYGPAAGMASQLGLHHDQEAIDDVERLVGMIASCDLVISVCNTTVHMAGALGVPCWCLVPTKLAWRYVSETDTMKWYRSVKLIHQGGRQWDEVIKDVRSKLADLGAVPRAESSTARAAA